MDFILLWLTMREETMEFKEVKNVDLPFLKKIVELEDEAFEGQGGVDLWILKALIRYGKVFMLEENSEIVSIVEYMQCFEKKEVFLYGICTRKKYRYQGNAKQIMKESEAYLKSLGYTAISLTVDPTNEIGIKLYKDLGYEVVEYQANEYGQGIHRYLMKKVII
jgi:ribosomal protein S18 acetylase RimI-like enzyme